MYATANLHDRYKQDYVTTASPIDLVIMLYDGAIKQMKLAKIHFEDNNLSSFQESVEKAEEIFLELIRSLNLDISMSNDLLDLYQFMVNELVQVSFNQEISRVDPVIEMMTSLRESWAEAKKKLGSNYSTNEG